MFAPENALPLAGPLFSTTRRGQSNVNIDSAENTKPMSRELILAIPLSIGALELTACGKNVLDYCNAQI
jgi:hypothetical protein